MQTLFMNNFVTTLLMMVLIFLFFIRKILERKFPDQLQKTSLKPIFKKTGRGTSAGVFLRTLARKHRIPATFFGRRHLAIIQSPGYYNIDDREINLLGDLYDDQSVISMGIITHEFGHAIIHRISSLWVWLRHYSGRVLNGNIQIWYLIIVSVINILTKNYLDYSLTQSMVIIPFALLLLPTLIDEFLASCIGFFSIVRIFKMSPRLYCELVLFYIHVYLTYLFMSTKELFVVSFFSKFL